MRAGRGGGCKSGQGQTSHFARLKSRGFGGADTVDKVELSSFPTRNALSQNIFRLFFVSVPVDRVWIEFSATNFVNRGSPTVLLVLHLVSTYRTCKTA